MDASGDGEQVLERPKRVRRTVIAFDAQGRLYWTESMSQRVRPPSTTARRTIFCQLPETHVPDGMAIALTGACSCARRPPRA